MNKKQLWTNKNELDQAYKNIIKPYLTANNSAVKIVHLDEYIAATTIKRILDRIVDTEWFANVYSTSVHTMHTLFEWLLTDPAISKQLTTVKNNDDNIISDIKHELKHFQKDELRNYALNNPINNLNESVTTHESNINSKHLFTEYR